MELKEIYIFQQLEVRIDLIYIRVYFKITEFDATLIFFVGMMLQYFNVIV